MNTNTQTPPSRSRAAMEWARELKSRDQIDGHALNEMLAEHQLNDLLESVDLGQVKGLVVKSTKDYLDVLRTVLEQSGERARRLKIELELEMFRDQVAEQKRKVREALENPQSSKGLTPETLRQIEEAMAAL